MPHEKKKSSGPSSILILPKKKVESNLSQWKPQIQLLTGGYYEHVV